jgi:hypothetical protein
VGWIGKFHWWQADYVQEDCFSLPLPGTEKELSRWTPWCVQILPHITSKTCITGILNPLNCLEDPTLYWTLICFLCVCDRGTVLQNASLLIFVSSCSFHAPDGISRIVAVHSQVDANEISKLAAKAREKQEILSWRLKVSLIVSYSQH